MRTVKGTLLIASRYAALGTVEAVMKDQRWQDWLTSLAGLFVFFASWIISSTPAVAWVLWMIGGAIAIIGMSALANPQRWEEWVALVLGLCLMASPHLLDFTDVTALNWTAVIVGAIVAIFSGWVLVAEGDIRF